MAEKSITRAYKEIYYKLCTCGVEMRIAQPILTSRTTDLVSPMANVWFLKYCIENNIAELIENDVCKTVFGPIKTLRANAYTNAYPYLLVNLDPKSIKKFITIDKIIFTFKASVADRQIDSDREYPNCEIYINRPFSWDDSKEGWSFWRNEYHKVQQTLKQKNEKYGPKLIHFFVTDILNDFGIIVKYYEKKNMIR